MDNISVHIYRPHVDSPEFVYVDVHGIDSQQQAVDYLMATHSNIVWDAHHPWIFSSISCIDLGDNLGVRLVFRTEENAQ